MGTRCMRPGCDRPATARLTYDPVACELWLDHMTGSRAGVQELCEFHAERLTVPRGWVATDRRAADAVPERVAAPPAVPEVVDVVPEVVDVVPEVPDVVAEVSGVVPEVSEVVPEVSDVAPGEEPAPADADADADADAEAVGRGAGAGADPGPPSSSLLGRAFAWTGPQHSVLTTPGAEPGSEGAGEQE